MPDLLSTIFRLARGVPLKQEAMEIPIKDILENPNQPREVFDEKKLEELSQSIKEVGVIQPIIVRDKRFNKYELVVGERRLRACKMLGLETIPAIVRSLSEKEGFALTLIENLQREDLNPVEEAKVYLRLIRDLKLTQREVAEKIGKSPHLISNMLKLLRLPQEVKSALISNGITKGHALAIFKLSTREVQVQTLGEIQKKRLNVRQTEKLVERKIREIKAKERRQDLQEDFEDSKRLNEIIDEIKSFFDGIKAKYERIKLKRVDRKKIVELKIVIPK